MLAAHVIVGTHFLVSRLPGLGCLQNELWTAAVLEETYSFGYLEGRARKFRTPRRTDFCDDYFTESSERPGLVEVSNLGTKGSIASSMTAPQGISN
jgi:hypothetical protein